MRWSQSFIPTLRDAPADAEAVSHKLLVRGGYIRQLHSGHYSLLPLGLKVHNKVANIVRKEMDAIGGQEFLLPAMHPATIWQQSGRWDVMGDEMFRLKDRSGVDLALGMTHEEIFSTLGIELKSYKELPQTWYQIQTKFRDEPRPKSGLLRVREFAMKDSYSFDLDQAGLDKSFTLHHDAYVKIFDQLGIIALPVQASSGSMGGSASIEFMVPSPAGEDDVIRCSSCDYRANVERGTSALEATDDKPGPDAPFRIATPGIRTISALAAIYDDAPASRQIKTLVVVIDDVVSLVLLRGDHQLNNQKLQDSASAINVRPADPEEIIAALGASPGSLGAVGVTDLPIYADHGL
ncbi:MAG: proline--tRNA ligase, partial [Acidimicrobiales bacterium]